MKNLFRLAIVGLITAPAALAGEIPSPALLVLHKGERAMAIVDPSTGKVVGHAPSGPDPHELVVVPGGKLAIATNYGGGPGGGKTLTVMDIAAGTEVRKVDLSPLSRPHGLWVSGGKVYFTAEASMAIGRYDPVADKVDWILGTGQDRTHMIALTPDGKTVVTSNVSANTISIIEPTMGGGPGGPPPGGPGGPGGPPPGGPPPGGPDGPPPGFGGGPPGGPDGPPPGGPGGPPRGGPGGPGGPPGGGPGWKQTVVVVGRGPEGFDITPDGKQVWAAHSGDGKVSVIDIASKKVIKVIEADAPSANRLKVTPDGKLALVSQIGGGGGLVVIDTADGTIRKRLKVGRGASGILIPPDGTKAFIAMTGDNAIAVIDLATLTEVARYNTGQGPDGMAWLEAKP